jgi:type IV pilus assembly protein PilN
VRVSINLATRPYVELDRLLRQLRIAIGVLAVAALGLGIWLHSMTAQAREQRRQLDRLNAQADTLQRERAANEARLRQPVNAATLGRNQFLNTLFARKSFSWTAVLMDLEDVVPNGVQVSSIEPLVSSSGEVTIRLRVLGDRERTVELVRNLEHSRRFIAPRLAGEAQQTANRTGATTIGANGLPQLVAATGANGLPAISGVEFEIVSGYNPLQPRVREQTAPHTAPAVDAAHDTAARKPARKSHQKAPVEDAGPQPAPGRRGGAR